MTSYIVIENTPGCLPEAEPVEFDTRSEAVSFANSLLLELRELGYRVKRNGHLRWQATQHHLDVGRVVEVRKEVMP